MKHLDSAVVRAYVICSPPKGQRMHGQPPVLIEPYNPAWPAMFAAEQTALMESLAPWLAGPIEHIGSTAVPGLPAKPVIDIMGGVHDLSSSRAAIEPLQRLSYCYFDYKADQMHWFCKPSDTERTHHLHLIPFGAPLWRERLAFRDRLRSDQAACSAYRDLKLGLASRFTHDREAYTEAKTGFIQSVLAGRSA